MTITITEAGTFIQSADMESVVRLEQLLRERKRTLQDLSILSIRVGSQVAITGNISPKVLKDLEGVVTTVRGKRCDIRLTKECTEKLRWERSRFYVGDAEEYVLGGVPMQVCEVRS